MAVLGKIVQWLLSGLAGFLTLSGTLRFFFTGDVLFPLVGLAALLVVFPPIQPVIDKRLPFLRARLLKIVLSLGILIAGMMVVSSTSPSLNNVKLCTSLKGGECASDMQLIAKNTPKLYLTGNPKQLRHRTKVKLELTAMPEPGKTQSILSIDTVVVINDGVVQFELAPKTLPVGAYEASLYSEDRAFFKINKPFTVWNSQQEIDQRLAKQLKALPTKVTNVKLCQSSDEKECPDDNTRYKGKITSLSISADLENAVDGVEVTYTWRRLGAQEEELMKRTRSLKSNVGYLSYTLKNDQGYDPGTYEVIVNLETSNAIPIRKEFTIQ